VTELQEVNDLEAKRVNFKSTRLKTLQQQVLDLGCLSESQEKNAQEESLGWEGETGEESQERALEERGSDNKGEAEAEDEERGKKEKDREENRQEDTKCCDTVTDVEKVDEIKDHSGQGDKEDEKKDREAEKMEPERKDEKAGAVEGIEIEMAMEVEGTAAMEVGRTAVVSADDRGARDELCQQSDLFLSDQSVSIFLSEQSVSMSLF